MGKLRLYGIFAALTALLCVRLHAQDFKKQVIYQVVTDRFNDGSSANDGCPQDSGMFDLTHTNWNLYWGGDLQGIQNELGFIQGMGATAIWISPPLHNVDLLDGGSAPYHGYSTDDFMKTDEAFSDCNEDWTPFDNLTAAAHNDGIQIVVDFPANDTNDMSAAEYGALYNNGTYVADCNNNWADDPNNIFHHNPGISNWTDRYQLQYYTLEGLCDLNQENPTVDSILKSSLLQLQQHGADAFRMDAVKHVTWGWEYSEANSIFNNAPSFIWGEWYEGLSDALFPDSAKFANKSGMSLYDYPLGLAIRDVFGNNNNFSEIDNTINTEDADFTWPNDLVVWFDNQDQPRLLSLDNDDNRLNEALAFTLTARGIPQIYYGDTQYIHNDTNGGGVPYNRNWMSSYNTSTTAYQLVQNLAALREGNNDALAYGGWQQRWINSDVYIYERQFFNDVVLVAINKNDTTGYAITGLDTALPPGNYGDELNGLMNGFGISVNSGSAGNNPVNNFTLGPATVAVWVSTGPVNQPEVGSIGPTVGEPGMQVTIAGKGFGASQGQVLFGSTGANIISWSDTSVVFDVPSVADGVYQVQLEDASGNMANTIQYTVNEANLIPVTFTVNNAYTNPGDNIYVTGNVVSLGDWGTTFNTAVGPMLTPNYPSWFLNVSVPACATIQYKYIDIHSDGTVTWEGGNNHTYTVPCSGVGYVNDNW